MSFRDEFGGAPTLKTERLVLREIRPEEDAEAFYRMTLDPEFMQYLPSRSMKSVEDAREALQERVNRFDNDASIPFAITLKGEDVYLGCVEYYRFYAHNNQIGELAYQLAKEHWNRGIMTEAVNALVAFGFEQLHLNRIEIQSHPGNYGSGGVASKAGFQKEANLREWKYDDARESWWDECLIYSLLRREYTAKCAIHHPGGSES